MRGYLLVFFTLLGSWAVSFAVPTVIRQMETVDTCPVDGVCFALDQSGSISLNYPDLQEFVIAVSREIESNSPSTLFSAFGFANDVSVIQSSTSELESQFVPAINAPVTPSGTTNMYAGLNACFTELTELTGIKVIVLLTDGVDNGSPFAIELAPTIKEQGIAIITVGIGSGVSSLYLQQLATSPDFFVASTFTTLPIEVFGLTQMLCELPMVSPFPTETAEVTPTVEVSPTLEVTETVEVTPTVEVSPTPEVTETVEVTATPEVSATPEVTETVEVTQTPEVSATPEVTETVEVTPTPEVTVTPVVTETPTVTTIVDACEMAFQACDFTFADTQTVPTLLLPSVPDQPFTSRIVSRNQNINIGVVNTNGIVPEFIEPDGSVVPITDETEASQPFSPTQFKPFSTPDDNGSAIGHETFQGNQAFVIPDRCVRVFITSFQILSTQEPFFVVGNVDATIDDNACVVFRTG
eukprot:gb/GEZJ01003194.1/.p1 GENE.gb/GEZJ01003194.1/~~gb/GEZJ01003194.1/.p1  ORF type:complete len:468 (-),score=51.20 gb/GEZJ01003194.1/:1540-2943(-)